MRRVKRFKQTAALCVAFLFIFSNLQITKLQAKPQKNQNMCLSPGSFLKTLFKKISNPKKFQELEQSVNKLAVDIVENKKREALEGLADLLAAEDKDLVISALNTANQARINHLIHIFTEESIKNDSKTREAVINSLMNVLLTGQNEKLSKEYQAAEDKNLFVLMLVDIFKSTHVELAVEVGQEDLKQATEIKTAGSFETTLTNDIKVSFSLGNLLPKVAKVYTTPENKVILINQANQQLFLEVIKYNEDYYCLKIGNAAYLARDIAETIDINLINPLGNQAYLNFFGLSIEDIAADNFSFALPVAEPERAKKVDLFPANNIQQANLLPPKVDLQTLTKARAFIVQAMESGKTAIPVYELLHNIAVVALNGDWVDYHFAQDTLNTLIEKNVYPENKEALTGLADFLYFTYVGCDWKKWIEISSEIQSKEEEKEETKLQRTQTLFELPVEKTRLPVEEPQNWEIVKVEALSDKDLEYIPTEEIALGEKSVNQGRVDNVLFDGGASTTPKKIVGAHKIVHPALKVIVDKNGQQEEKWISIGDARTGLILGLNPNSKVTRIASVAGTIAGESDRSIRLSLEQNYAKELQTKQISVSMQRAGLVLDNETGYPLRYTDGHVAACAENHLWAFLAGLMDKESMVDMLENRDGILSVGNGDNVLNFTRKGMVDWILKARQAGKPVATVAVCSPSNIDRKGGIGVKVTYQNKTTGEQMSQNEMREISEFPARGNKGFKAVTIRPYNEEEADFYEQCDDNGWFIEDIFGEKNVAFNVAFYAVDARLFLARMFGFAENDPDLVTKLKNTTQASWSEKILELAQQVPMTRKPDKGVPNEDDSLEVKGYMTEQAVQDFIVNALALLADENLPAPTAEILLAPRKDVFLPYKGTKMPRIGEKGEILEGGEDVYDLIAQQLRYKGIIKELIKQDGHYVVLGENERVLDIIPVETLEELIKATQDTPLVSLLERMKEKIKPTITLDEILSISKGETTRAQREVIIEKILSYLEANLEDDELIDLFISALQGQALSSEQEANLQEIVADLLPQDMAQAFLNILADILKNAREAKDAANLAGIFNAEAEKSFLPEQATPEVRINTTDLMMEIDQVMSLLGTQDYARIIQTFKTSTDPKALVNELQNITGKTIADILTVLEKIDFFKSIAASYRVRTLKTEEIDKKEFESTKLSVAVNAEQYTAETQQPHIEGQPISDYLKLMRDESGNVPFVFRDEMEKFVGRFLGKALPEGQEATPDLLVIINRLEGFLKGIDLTKIKYVFTSGIGANEMYSHQLAAIVNAYFEKQGIDFKWIVVNNPADVEKIPGGATNDNTLVFEMSRSGSTKETVDFFNATRDRFKNRIVTANKGALKEAAQQLEREGGKILIIDDTPGDIEGRQMNRKTLMVYAPLFVALASGFKDQAKAKESLKDYGEALTQANEELGYQHGLDSSAINLAEFLFRHRASGRNRFSVVYDNSLKASSKELFQLLNEGANKNIAGGTNNNILDSYSLEDDKERYQVVFDKTTDSQVSIFLLNKQSETYEATLKYIEDLEAKGIPCITITVDTTDDLADNLKALARTSALLQDTVVYFTYITNQDANSNPAVKFVREITAAMFDILKAKKAQGEIDIKMTFEDVIAKIQSKQQSDGEKAKQDIDKLGGEKAGYKPVFAQFRDALKALATQLGISEEFMSSALMAATSQKVVKIDVGEAAGAKNAMIREAFSRSVISQVLGKATPDPEITSLDQQQILKEEAGTKISVATAKEGALSFTPDSSKSLPEQLAEYLLTMYKERKEDFMYAALTFMEVDKDNPELAELARMLTKIFADLGITIPMLSLPGAAHTGIEAAMSHPENLFNIAIMYTDSYEGKVGKNEIDEFITINDATYVYGISNVIRMAIGGTPSIIFEAKNSKNLQGIKETLEEALTIFKDKAKLQTVKELLQQQLVTPRAVSSAIANRVHSAVLMRRSA